MKSSQTLQIIGGIVGLGIVGAVTTLILTREENEGELTPSGTERFFGNRKPFGPISLPVTLTTDDPNNVIHNNVEFNLGIDYNGDSEDVDGFVYAGSETAFGIAARRKPTLFKKARVRVGKNKKTTVKIKFDNLSSSETIVIAFSANSEAVYGIYNGELKVTIIP